jgi:hypothetical protein
VGVAGAGEEKVAIAGPRRDGRNLTGDGDGGAGPAIAGGGEAKTLGRGEADLEGAVDLGELAVGGVDAAGGGVEDVVEGRRKRERRRDRVQLTMPTYGSVRRVLSTPL